MSDALHMLQFDHHHRGRWFISLAVLTFLSQGISGDNASGTSSLNGDVADLH